MKKLKEFLTSNLFYIKLLVCLILITILIYLCINMGVKFNGYGKSYEKIEYDDIEKDEYYDDDIFYGGISLEDEINDTLIEKSKENPELDTDGDGLTNLEEIDLGTSLLSSDTDADGLTDYEEVRTYGSDPTKYSTSGDKISDYIKIKKGLDINTKYSISEVQPSEVVVNDYIVLKPKDLESEFYGGIEEFSYDTISTFPVFDVLNFEGTIEYDTKDRNSILVIRDGIDNYIEFKNYKNRNGKLIIEVTEEDNWKDFVITTKSRLNKR